MTVSIEDLLGPEPEPEPEPVDLSNPVPPRPGYRRGRGNPVYRPEFAEQARKLCDRMAATNSDLAYFFDVSPKTINVWKVLHPAFGEAVRLGKEAADDRVEFAFYERCVGFEVSAEKIFMPAGASKPVRAKTREYYPPEPGAAMFWLKNRRPDRWRDRKEVGIGGETPGSPLRVQDIPASMTDADIAYLSQLG